MRIATYNVKNLLADGKPAAELQALVGTIDALSADVLLLQEVGSANRLAATNEALTSPYPFIGLLPGNSNRGIHLAVMSREPFELTSHRSEVLTDEQGTELGEYDSQTDAEIGRSRPLLLQRDLLLTELALDGLGTLALFNMHLKSKTNQPWRRLAADVIRAAECRTVARIVARYLAIHPRRPVIVGGDFNDTRHSEALSPLFELPLVDPLGEVLARSGRNPSTYWPKRRMRLDFLLVSEQVRGILVPDSGEIHTGARARRASDHYPVSLEIDDARWLEGGD